MRDSDNSKQLMWLNLGLLLAVSLASLAHAVTL